MHTRLFSLTMMSCLMLAAFVPAVSTKSNQPSVRFGRSIFTRSVKSPPQRSKRSRGRRARRTTTSTTNNNASTGTQRPASSPSSAPTHPSASQGPLSQISYELPIKRPRAGEERVQGLLMRVNCEARGVTFIVGVGERQLKLRTANLNLVKFTTYTPEVSGEVTCGARKPANNTIIIYRPAKDARSRFNGELVSVEFVPRDFKLKQ